MPGAGPQFTSLIVRAGQIPPGDVTKLLRAQQPKAAAWGLVRLGVPGIGRPLHILCCGATRPGQRGVRFRAGCLRMWQGAGGVVCALLFQVFMGRLEQPGPAGLSAMMAMFGRHQPPVAIAYREVTGATEVRPISFQFSSFKCKITCGQWLPSQAALEAGGFSGQQVDEEYFEVLEMIKKEMALK